MADNFSSDNSDLAEIEALLNDLDPGDLELLDPPADLWVGIEQALAEETPGSELAEETAGYEAAAPPTGNVVSLASRRNRFLAPALAIAAAAVLMIGGIVVFNGRSGSEPEVVASAVLEFDTGFDQLGSAAGATVDLIDDDNAYEISIAEATLPDPSGEDADLEMWMIEVDDGGNITGIVSLGIVDDTNQTFPVPDGIDPVAYSVVDISIEPHDGDHDHSGRSILRGQLSA